MTYWRKQGPAAVATVAILLALAGCQDKLAHERFSQIQVHGSTRGEVTALIGEPDDDLGDQWLYQRPDKHLTVLVDFDERGLVSRKQWIDADAELWEDTESPAPARPSSSTPP